MRLPPFSDFLKDMDMNKLHYDMAYFLDLSGGSSSLDGRFTKEQYNLIVQTTTTSLFAYLQRYHEWLSEELQKGPQ